MQLVRRLLSVVVCVFAALCLLIAAGVSHKDAVTIAHARTASIGVLLVALLAWIKRGDQGFDAPKFVLRWGWVVGAGGSFMMTLLTTYLRSREQGPHDITAGGLLYFLASYLTFALPVGFLFSRPVFWRRSAGSR